MSRQKILRIQKKASALLLSVAVTLTLTGCNNSQAQQSSVAESNEVTTENMSGMANPLVESDYDSIVKLTGCKASIPENAENPVFVIISNEIGEASYTTDNGYNQMCFRVQKCDEFTDISGMYYDWDNISEDSLLEFECTEMGAHDDNGDVRVCLWYDSSNKIMYSLSAMAKDLNGYDLYAVASSMM